MQDEIKKILAYNGRISITCASTTNLVEEARNIHDLSPVATAAMGRILTIAAIMGSDAFLEPEIFTVPLIFLEPSMVYLNILPPIFIIILS